MRNHGFYSGAAEGACRSAERAREPELRQPLSQNPSRRPAPGKERHELCACCPSLCWQQTRLPTQTGLRGTEYLLDKGSGGSRNREFSTLSRSSFQSFWIFSPIFAEKGV